MHTYNPEISARYILQNHPKGRLWNDDFGWPKFPEDWNEWKPWSKSEKLLYFIGLNLWNGYADPKYTKLDPSYIIETLDENQVSFLEESMRKGMISL
ncbi:MULTISPECIES: hypothetical protein [Erysipelotrichaceae]|uniref:hypothetical protein n=1 Tax=Erysipelotrichaceae TaxID=128827 RepID=UPI0023F1E500|nr:MULTISPECIES: hypothetical protein [Erysipelotrichaceae]